jgi:hypothetical protein
LTHSRRKQLIPDQQFFVLMDCVAIRLMARRVVLSIST